MKTKESQRTMELAHGFALTIGENTSVQFEVGEGLTGQAAASGATLYLDEIPEGYIKIVSGLGSASPRFLTIVPMKGGHEVKGVLEMATFSPMPEAQIKQVEEQAQLLAE